MRSAWKWWSSCLHTTLQMCVNKSGFCCYISNPECSIPCEPSCWIKATWETCRWDSGWENLAFQKVVQSLGTPQVFHTLSERQFWLGASLMSHAKDKHRAISLPKLFGTVQVHGSAVISLVTAVFSYPIGWMLTYLHLSVRRIENHKKEYLTYIPLHDGNLVRVLVYLLVLPVRSWNS